MVDTLNALLWHVAGALAVVEGKFGEAHRWYSQSNLLAERLGQTDYILFNLINLAQMAMASAGTETSRIVQGLSTVEADARRVGYVLPRHYQARMETLFRIATTWLDAKSFASAQAKGMAMSLDAAIALMQTATDKRTSETIAGPVST